MSGTLIPQQGMGGGIYCYKRDWPFKRTQHTLMGDGKVTHFSKANVLEMIVLPGNVPACLVWFIFGDFKEQCRSSGMGTTYIYEYMPWLVFILHSRIVYCWTVHSGARGGLRFFNSPGFKLAVPWLKLLFVLKNRTGISSFRGNCNGKHLMCRWQFWKSELSTVKCSFISVLFIFRY
jgi:hypothetical protein